MLSAAVVLNCQNFIPRAFSMNSAKPKRSASDMEEEDLSYKKKKQNLELCPHAVKCYRRNPHHFKEYDHPHLTKYIYMNGDLTFPADFTQDKQVYMEQLAVLRDLKKIKGAPVANGTASTSQTFSCATMTQAIPKVSTSSSTPQRQSAGVSTVSRQLDTTPKQSQATSTSNQANTMSSSRFWKAAAMPTNIPNNSSFKRNLKHGSTMREKLEICAPYNLFFTKVPKATQTLSGYNCISFPDLICPSLGILVNSLQLNFMIDVSWLVEQYQVHNLQTTPITIVYGYDFPKMDEYITKNLPNVTPHMVHMNDPFGIHHCKVGIYKYEHGAIRIVVSTANLYYEDWNHYNQALWLSPELPVMDASKQDFECAGPTGFKTDFLNYLKTYKLGVLSTWIDLVKRADFSAVKVFFVYSAPGRHFPKQNGSHLHRVGELLSKHCVLPVKTTPDSEGALSWGINAQSSSLGSFGKSAGDWLRPTFLRALASHKGSPLSATPKANLNIIYPTVNNVLQSHFGPQGGGCLPYSKASNDKQKWLKEYLHVWKADELGRSRAMPHIKSYVRVSPCLTKLAWCVITSANISKAAWGNSPGRDGGTYMRSYEAGVIFMPHAFDEEYFYLARRDGDQGPLFPVIYDLPLEPYKVSDEPWCN